MTQRATWPDKSAIRLWKNGARYLAIIEGLNVHGFGNSPVEALDVLLGRYEEVSEFAERLQLPVNSLIVAGQTSNPKWRPSSWQSILATTFLIVVAISILMVPLSYALSSGLERGANNIARMFPFSGNTVWDRIEAALTAGQAKHLGLAPGQAERIGRELHALAEDIQPITAEFGGGVSGSREVPK